MAHAVLTDPRLDGRHGGELSFSISFDGEPGDTATLSVGAEYLHGDNWRLQGDLASCEW